MKPSGERESWSCDPVKGSEVTEVTSGVRTTRRWFVSGPAAGKDRDLVVERKVDGNIVSSIKKLTYDEKGRFLREVETNASDGSSVVTREVSYYPNGKKRSDRNGERVVWYDINGQPAELFEGGRCVWRLLRTNGKISSIETKYKN